MAFMPFIAFIFCIFTGFFEVLTLYVVFLVFEIAEVVLAILDGLIKQFLDLRQFEKFFDISTDSWTRNKQEACDFV